MPITFKNLNTIKNSKIQLIKLSFTSSISVQEFQQWLIDMADLLAKKQPFFIIYHSEPLVNLPNDYRYQEAQWYKTYKSEFFQYCQGLVRIANNEAERIKLDTPAMHKAWKVPYTVVLTEKQANDWLNQQIKTTDL